MFKPFAANISRTELIWNSASPTTNTSHNYYLLHYYYQKCKKTHIHSISICWRKPPLLAQMSNKIDNHFLKEKVDKNWPFSPQISHSHPLQCSQKSMQLLPLNSILSSAFHQLCWSLFQNQNISLQVLQIRWEWIPTYLVFLSSDRLWDTQNSNPKRPWFENKLTMHKAAGKYKSPSAYSRIYYCWIYKCLLNLQIRVPLAL
jgi:hypothetical protein